MAASQENTTETGVNTFEVLHMDMVLENNRVVDTAGRVLGFESMSHLDIATRPIDDLKKRHLAFVAKPPLTGIMVALAHPRVGIAVGYEDPITIPVIRRYVRAQVQAALHLEEILAQVHDPASLYTSMVTPDELEQSLLNAYDKAAIGMQVLCDEVPPDSHLIVTGFAMLPEADARSLAGSLPGNSNWTIIDGMGTSCPLYFGYPEHLTFPDMGLIDETQLRIPG